MEQQQSTFQWSIFTHDRQQQYVVRCDDFEQFSAAIQQVLRILPELERQVTAERINTKEQGTPAAQPPAKPTEPERYCPIHTGKRMKSRTSTDGQTWYDHRWKDESEHWHACNGERERIDNGAWQVAGSPTITGGVNSSLERW